MSGYMHDDLHGVKLEDGCKVSKRSRGHITHGFSLLVHELRS